MFQSLSIRATSVLVSASVLFPVHDCKADSAATTPASDRVTSQVLFERGRELFIERHFAEACPILAESQRLAPGIGVLLHLGACFEKLGKFASAWAAFQEAADRARAEGDSERESMARARAAELRDKLSYMTLRLHQAGSADMASPTNLPSGVQVERDGNVVSTAALELEEPVDPGHHIIIVRVPEMQEVTRDITLAEGEHSSVDVELVPLPRSQPRTPMAGVNFPRREMPAPMTPTRPMSGASSAWPSVAWASVGIGAVGLLTGSAAGLIAYTKMQDARALCDGYPKNQCPDEAVRLQEQARLPASIATAGVAVGVGCLAFAGGYWLVNRSGRTVVTGSVSPGNTLIALRTRW